MFAIRAKLSLIPPKWMLARTPMLVSPLVQTRCYNHALLLHQAGEVEHAAYMTVEKQLKTGPTNVLGQCLCSAECLGLVSLASPSQMVTDGQYSSLASFHCTFYTFTIKWLVFTNVVSIIHCHDDYVATHFLVQVHSLN